MEKDVLVRQGEDYKLTTNLRKLKDAGSNMQNLIIQRVEAKRMQPLEWCEVDSIKEVR